MTAPMNPPTPEEPAADETFTWTQPSESHRATGSPGAATSLLESVRDAVDELAERAAPSVREFSARAAELAAIAADRAAPLAKRAGEVTADASGKLASKSREWAADLRATVTTAGQAAEDHSTQPAPTAGLEPAEAGDEPPQEPSDGN